MRAGGEIGKISSYIACINVWMYCITSVQKEFKTTPADAMCNSPHSCMIPKT